MLSVVSAVPVWLWIVLVNLAAVVWYATGEVEELQVASKHASKRTPLAVRVLVMLCACVLGALFWLAARMGEQLRRQRLMTRGTAKARPEDDEAIRRAVDRLRQVEHRPAPRPGPSRVVLITNENDGLPSWVAPEDR